MIQSREKPSGGTSKAPLLASVPLSSPPPALPPPHVPPFLLCLHLSISALLLAAQSAHPDSGPRRRPRLQVQRPSPRETIGMSSEKSGKKQNLTPSPASPDSPPTLGPNLWPQHPPLPLPKGWFYFIPLLYSPQCPQDPHLFLYPSLLFLSSYQSHPRPLASNMGRGQVERVRKVQKWLSISQVLHG